MWLTLLLDKSVLQGLGRDEFDVLDRYYRLILPPVLLTEVLGDLAKTSDDLRPTWTAEKITQVSQHASIDWPVLLEQELLGHPVPLEGSILIPLSKEVVDPQGGLIRFAEEQPAERALRRWREGHFIEAEREAARHWRQLDKRLSPDRILSAFTDIYLPTHIRSPTELQAAVFGVTSHLGNQDRLLDACVQVFGLDGELASIAQKRWRDKGSRRFDVFAP